jgi:hypothetical protein
MTWNVTGIQNAGNLWAMAKASNDAVGQVYFTLLLVVLFFIILVIGMRNNDFLESLMASSWITFILGFFLTIAQLVNLKITIGFLVIAGFATLYKYMNPD